MNKPTLTYCNKLLDDGFSLLTVGHNKVPNFSWKDNQQKPLSKKEFEKRYNYNGGITLKSGDEMLPTMNVGIITGYNNLEVLDIDLKVFESLKQQQDFWKELLNFWKDNIDDFESKFVIYKTVNNGYHILYRCKEITGNKKIASLKGHAEAIIESRGIGGYVFIYDKSVNRLYSEVQEISVKDREVLWQIAETYNYIEPKKEVEVEKLQKKEYPESEITPWEDYNNQTNILDLLNDGFEVIRNLSDKYIIKRYGATSAHSGYVYKDSNCMYLFSTGTIYDAQKLHTPFSVYTTKYHGGNFTEASRELYKKGYGSRIVKPIEVPLKEYKVDENKLIFPLDIFPKDYQTYILECNKTLSLDIDYMGCSLLWLASVIIGNSMEIEVKIGWKEKAVLWMAMVGRAGIGKTPSIKKILYPLLKINNREIANYMKNLEKYEHFTSLTKEEKKTSEEVEKPRKTQFIANDITIEALVDLHEQNKNSVGVFKDELAGWLKDMNKYRAGSDLEFWLSTWSGDPANFNRLSRRGSFVQNPFISVLGGIQPNILDMFYTAENKDNGFVDRLLLCYPDLEVEHYNENEMNEKVIEFYESAILHFFNSVKSILNFDNEGEIEPVLCKWTAEAKKEWVRIFNSITDIQNSDEENEYLKSMYPKQKSYIPRFSLLINAFNFGTDTIEQESILKAERLSNYFIEMAKKIKVGSTQNNEIKKIVEKSKSKTSFEQFADIFKENTQINKTQMAELFGVSRQTIINWSKKCN